MERWSVVIQPLGSEGLSKTFCGQNCLFALSMDGEIEPKTTEPSKMEADGSVIWSTDIVQEFDLEFESNGQRKTKFCNFRIIVQVDNSEDGEVLSETALDMNELCFAGPDAHTYTINLHPQGCLHLNISSRCLVYTNGSGISDINAADVDVAAISATEYESTSSGSDNTDRTGVPKLTSTSASEVDELQSDINKLEITALGNEEEEEEDGDAVAAPLDAVAATMPTSTKPTASIDGSFQSWLDQSSVGGASVPTHSLQSSDAVPDDDASMVLQSESMLTPLSDSQAFGDDGHYATPNSGLHRSYSDMSELKGDPAQTIATLKKKYQRLIQAREEARAETFAQATVAVQQGIEIENLKRAKEMLLMRLEVAEAELLASCRPGSGNGKSTKSRSDASSNPNSPKHQSGGGTDSTDKTAAANTTSSQQQQDDDDDNIELVKALVTAKVELAQKDYLIMELQGAIRHIEAHANSLEGRVAQLTEANLALKAASFMENSAVSTTPSKSATQGSVGSRARYAFGALRSEGSNNRLFRGGDDAESAQSTDVPDSAKKALSPQALLGMYKKDNPVSSEVVGVGAAAVTAQEHGVEGKMKTVSTSIHITAHAGEPVAPVVVEV